MIENKVDSKKYKMKKYALIFNIALVFQTVENSTAQEPFDYVEYVILLICFVIASIVMMLIPVILCYSMIGGFMALRSLKNKAQTENSLKVSSINYLKSVHEKYIIASKNFYKNLFALATWNVFSLVYVVSEFDAFIEGLKEYFYFPLNIFQSLSKEDIFDSIHKFQSNWIYMIGIVMLTFTFYFLGKYFGKIIAQSKFDKIEIIQS